MEVEVANGSWRHGLILSVRLGEVRRQAPLDTDTRIIFPKASPMVQYMHVDVFAKVGSERVIIDPAKKVYDLNTDGEGFSSLALRVHPHWEVGSGRVSAADEHVDHHSHDRSLPQDLPKLSKPAPSDTGSGETVGSIQEEKLHKVRQDAVEYIERFKLRHQLQEMFQQVIKERPDDPYGFMQKILQRSAADKGFKIQEPSNEKEQELERQVASQREKIESQREKIESLQQEVADARVETAAAHGAKEANAAAAKAAIAEHDALQKDYQGRLERQRAELEEKHRNETDAKRVELEQRSLFVERQRTDLEQRHSSELQSQRSELEQRHQSRLSELEKLYEQRIEQQTTNIGMLQRRIQELEASVTSSDAAVQDQRALEQQRTALMKQQETNIDSLQRRVQELETGVQTQQRLRQEADAEHRNAMMQQEAKADAERRNEMMQQEAKINSMHQQRIQELESEASAKHGNIAREMQDREELHKQQVEQQEAQIEMLQRRIQAFETAAAQQQQQQQQRAADDNNNPNVVQWVPPRQESPADHAAGIAKDPSTAALTTVSTAMPMSQSVLSKLPGPLGATSEINTHMFSRLLASTYAPPVPPNVYLERREDEEHLEIENVDPGLIVEVKECNDPMTNGIFAWVGVCNMKPLYRLLGAEPRYLFFADNDRASDWRIVDKMGSDAYIERFRKPKNTRLPTQCDRGSHGSVVAQVTLTRKIVQQISMIASHEEKSIIRGKFTEVFGSQFKKLEGVQYGLISKTAPVVGIAHALESQQRAIQLLHSQVSSETQRREAAETHARIMEEAFETLQLRIQAQLPGPPTLASMVDLKAVPPVEPEKSESAAPPVSQDRGLILEQDGTTAWAPDINTGCGPVPRPPVAHKDVKPVPPPTFRKLPAGLRNSRPGSARRLPAVVEEHPSPPAATGDAAPGQLVLADVAPEQDHPVSPIPAGDAVPEQVALTDAAPEQAALTDAAPELARPDEDAVGAELVPTY